jgi:hypothetical protein
LKIPHLSVMCVCVCVVCVRGVALSSRLIISVPAGANSG